MGRRHAERIPARALTRLARDYSDGIKKRRPKAALKRCTKKTVRRHVNNTEMPSATNNRYVTGISVRDCMRGIHAMNPILE
jgi:hypothetical protein